MSINTVGNALRVVVTKGGGKISRTARAAIGVLSSYGTNAHVYLPGVGMLNGLQAANYIDSAGTQAGVVDSIVGKVEDGFGSIHATQTTTGSKPILRKDANGKYYWQFDGSNDSLQLGGVPFSQTDDRVVVAGFQSTKASGASTIFDVSNSALGGTPIAARLEQDSSGLLHAYFRDNVGVLVNIAHNSGTSATAVASIQVISGARALRVNGVVRGTNATALGSTTLLTACIGVTANNLNPAQGSIYPIIAIKGTVQDADLLLLEKLVASMSGVTI